MKQTGLIKTQPKICVSYFEDNKLQIISNINSSLSLFQNNYMTIEIQYFIKDKITSIEDLELIIKENPELEIFFYNLSMSINRVTKTLYLKIWPVVYGA